MDSGIPDAIDAQPIGIACRSIINDNYPHDCYQRRGLDAVVHAALPDLVGRAAGSAPFAAAHEKTEVVMEIGEPLLESAANGRGYAAGVPVKAKDAAERLEPERIRKALEQTIRAVLRDQQGHDVAR